MKRLLALVLLTTAFNAFAGNDMALSQFENLFATNRSVEDSIRKFQNLEKLRQAAQNSLDALLKSHPGNVEIEMRYAELLMQRARDLEQLSLDLSTSGKNAEGQKTSVLAKQLARQGLSYHARVLAKEKRHPLAAKIYLSMGRTELALKNPTKALKAVDLGLAAPDQSDKSILMHLWILRGDVAFDLLNLKTAYESYKKAEKLAQAATLEEAYIAYKLAWVHYNTKETQVALGLLEKVMALSADKYALKQEAIGDYGIFVADLDPKLFAARGGAKGIYAFLEKNGDSKSARQALQSMATFIAKNGKRENAVTSLEFLMAQDSLHQENLDLALQIVEWTHHFANKQRLADRYLWLLKDYGPQSAWYRHHKLNPELQEDALAKVERSLRVYAEGLHKEAVENKNPKLQEKDLQLVVALYEAHTAAFPDVASVHYYAAEIYRDRQDFERAARHYDHHIRVSELARDLNKLEKEHLKEAYSSSVEMWARAVEKNSKLSPDMLQSVDHFLLKNPTHAKAAQVAMGAARTELRYGNKATALVRLDKIIQQYPRSAESSEAVHASLDILAKEGDLTNVSVKASQWLATIDVWAPAQEKNKLRSELQNIFSKTEAKSCEQIAGQADSKIEAALCFQAFAPKAPTPALAARALLLAADNFEKANDINGAFAALEQLVRDYASSAEALSASSRLATHYEKSFQFEKAIAIYEGLLKRKDTKDADKVRQRLLTLLHGLGQDDKLEAKLAEGGTSAALKAQFRGVAFSDRFNSLLREEHLYGMAKGSFVSGRAQRIFQEMSRKHAQLSAEQRIEMARLKGLLAASRGNATAAQREWKLGLSYFRSLGSKNQNAWNAAAKLQLDMLRPEQAAFERASLKRQPQKKVSLFQKLEREYGQIVALNAPTYALEALAKTSANYLVIANEAKTAGVPAAQVAQYERRALEIRRHLGQKARDWRMMNPTVVAVFRNAEGPASFPWFDLPRWLDLSADQKTWGEWDDSNAALESRVKKSTQRGELSRAAFVLISRRASLKDAKLAQLASLWTDKAGIQLRIQAHLQDGDLEKATLFLKQYEAYFGADAFTEHHLGRFDWISGNYASAYNRWSRTRFNKDFRSMYWTQGWISLIDYLVDGRSSPRRRDEVLGTLKDLAVERWQQQYMASLCLIEAMSCTETYKIANVLDLVGNAPVRFKKDFDDRFAFETSDARSAWAMQKGSLTLFIEKSLTSAQKKDDLKDAQRALSGMRALKSYARDAKKLGEDIDRLEKRLDKKQAELERAEKKVMASARQPSSAKKAKAQIVYEKKTKIDLTEKDVDGQILKPDSHAIRGDQNLTFDSLVKPRNNFQNEMKRNSGALR